MEGGVAGLAVGARLTDGNADWIWLAAEKAGLPIMFLAPGRNAVPRRSRNATRG